MTVNGHGPKQGMSFRFGKKQYEVVATEHWFVAYRVYPTGRFRSLPVYGATHRTMNDAIAAIAKDAAQSWEVIDEKIPQGGWE